MGRQARPSHDAANRGAALSGRPLTLRVPATMSQTTTKPSVLRWRIPMSARLPRAMFSLIGVCFMTSTAMGDEPAAKPVKKTIRADDGVNLVCDVCGRGDTALIFLHGWCGDREYWKNQAEAFAGDYRVV